MYQLQLFQELPIHYLKSFKPLIYKQIERPGYIVDCEGNVISLKRREPRILKLYWPKRPRDPYPEVTISINAKSTSVDIHRLVAETWHPEFPIPSGIEKEIWESAHHSIRELLEGPNSDFWEVDHIDQNPMNFHPDNLHWVASSENRRAYLDFLKNK